MPLVPEEPEAPPTPSERVKRVIEPVRTHRNALILALAAAGGSLAPFPLGPITAALLVIAAGDAARRK